jgi:hypothetical protein
MTGIIINGVLVLFGAGMIYMLLWRILFFDTNREPEPTDIEAFIARCKRGGSLEPQGRFGAIGQCFDEAGRDAKALRMSLDRFRRLVERFHDAVSVVANAAMGIGFLGTVVSMAGAAGGKVDPVQIIGLGMMSTMYGMMIALPGSMFHGLTNGRVMRFLDYTDALLEALDERNNPPTSPAFVPSPGNGPPSNGRAQKRMPPVESGNGRHVGNETKLREGIEPATSDSSSVAWRNGDTQGSAIDQVLAADMDFDGQVVGWIDTQGDVQNETTT